MIYKLGTYQCYFFCSYVPKVLHCWQLIAKSMEHTTRGFLVFGVEVLWPIVWDFILTISCGDHVHITNIEPFSLDPTLIITSVLPQKYWNNERSNRSSLVMIYLINITMKIFKFFPWNKYTYYLLTMIITSRYILQVEKKWGKKMCLPDI